MTKSRGASPNLNKRSSPHCAAQPESDLTGRSSALAQECPTVYPRPRGSPSPARRRCRTCEQSHTSGRRFVELEQKSITARAFWADWIVGNLRGGASHQAVYGGRAERSLVLGNRRAGRVTMRAKDTTKFLLGAGDDKAWRTRSEILVGIRRTLETGVPKQSSSARGGSPRPENQACLDFMGRKRIYASSNRVDGPVHISQDLRG